MEALIVFSKIYDISNVVLNTADSLQAHGTSYKANGSLTKLADF